MATLARLVLVSEHGSDLLESRALFHSCVKKLPLDCPCMVRSEARLVCQVVVDEVLGNDTLAVAELDALKHNNRVLFHELDDDAVLEPLRLVFLKALLDQVLVNDVVRVLYRLTVASAQLGDELGLNLPVFECMLDLLVARRAV